MSLGLPPLDGRLELRGLLGEGGMGQVYRAWDHTLERAVAVKFVRGSDPTEAERLLLEARLQARVEHPNVVRVHEVGTLDGRPCIVMQLVEGGTLASHGRDLPLKARIDLLREAALGLHAAHLQGLIHRDVKPGNVLVERSDEGLLRALVSDFGLARDEEGGLTRSGLPAGTLDFMAPELLLGAGPMDFRVDVYALGATAYALLSGRLPFRATTARGDGQASQLPTDPGDSTHLLRRILEEDPAPLSDVPEDLRTIVAKAMEKAPTDRYASAEAFAQDLERFMKGEPVLARRATTFDRLSKWSRRNPTAARASVAALLTIVLGLGYGFWTTRRAARQSLETARLGALAESIEARVRMENLAPAHNLQPVLDQIRTEADTLRPRVKDSGPAAFALGRALELLGDWAGSRAAYQQAWDSGYRSPQVAEALGLALIHVYDQDLRRARNILAPEAFKARQAQLDHTLRDPALALLVQGDVRGWRYAWGQALLDMIRGDFEGARQRARSLRERDAQRYEAWTLEGEIWVFEAGRDSQENRFPEAGWALEQAIPVLEQAMAWGRSDNRPRGSMAALHRLKGALLQIAGKDPAPETAKALDWLTQALALTPDNPDLLLQQADVLHRQAMSPSSDGASRLRSIERCLQIQEQANTLRPNTASVLITLADYWGGLATMQANLGQTTRVAVDKGLARLQEAAVLAPTDPMVPRAEIFLHLREAYALRAEGKDSEPAIRAGLASAERALQLETINPAAIHAWRIQAQMELGREAWRHGRDPRPDLMAAASAAEALIKQVPDDVNVLDNAIGCLYSVADQLTDLAGDVGPLLDRALALVDKGLVQSPDYPAFLALKAKLHMSVAYWRCLHDQDPTAAIAEGRKHLTKVGTTAKGLVNLEEVRALFSLMEARWNLHLGKSPEPALAELDRHLGPLLRNPATAHAGVLQNLALSHLMRGQWAQHQRRPSADPVGKGLGFIGRAIQLDPGDPSLRVVEARLRVLAGEIPAARQCLQEARKLNPLIERGIEYQVAQRESGPP
jgi:serine/threonine-protein kinase